MARARAKSIRWGLVAAALTLALGDLVVPTPAQAARQAGGDAIDRDPRAGSWPTTWQWSDAAIASPGATSSAWSFRFAPRGGSGRYRVAVWGRDASGRLGPRQRAAFTGSIGGGGRRLVWSDEFNGNRLDPNRWKTVSGLYGTPYRIQNYTPRPRNVRVENGRLVLQAHPEQSNGQHYTSGMVVSNDVREAANHSHRGNTGWTHGRFVMRARLPDIPGVWPAFWMRPEHGVYGSWPRSGEIDIIEYPGPSSNSWHNRRIVHGLHWWSSSTAGNHDKYDDNNTVSAAWLDRFHTFAVDWTSNGFRWYVDGRRVDQAGRGWQAPGASYPAPFNKDFFITLNLQIGGWAGNVADSQLPGTFEIDWVRVYR